MGDQKYIVCLPIMPRVTQHKTLHTRIVCTVQINILNPFFSILPTDRSSWKHHCYKYNSESQII